MLAAAPRRVSLAARRRRGRAALPTVLPGWWPLPTKRRVPSAPFVPWKHACGWDSGACRVLSSAAGNGGAWGVWRMDTHGTQVLIRTLRSKSEAEAVARDFERRAHKQTYWVERTQPGDVRRNVNADARHTDQPFPQSKNG